MLYYYATLHAILVYYHDDCMSIFRGLSTVTLSSLRRLLHAQTTRTSSSRFLDGMCVLDIFSICTTCRWT